MRWNLRSLNGMDAQRLAAERGWHALRKPVQPQELQRMLLRAQQQQQLPQQQRAHG